MRFRFLILIPLLVLACSRPISPQQQASSPRRQQPRPAAAPVSTPVPAPAPPEPARPCPSKPNILIVSLDTLRADATQLDPRSRNRTPVLQRLAASGVNFTTAYSTWDSTPSSHFSMLSGYITGYQSDIDKPDASIAYQLHKLGYRTFGLAANYNLSPAAMRMLVPFDSFENLAQEFESSPALIDAWCDRINATLAARHATQGDWYTTMIYYAAPNVVRKFEQTLDRNHGKGPFLAFVNFMDTHDPYLPSPKFYDYSQDPPNLTSPRSRPLDVALKNPAVIPDAARRELFNKKIEQAQGRAWSTTFDLSEEELAAYRRRYYAEARELDAGIGQLIEVLRRRGLLNSTILVFTADHGESLGEDGLLSHSFGNAGDREVTNRVNLLFVFPPCYRIKGVRISDYCTIADIVPTLYDLLGVDASPLWERSVPGNYGRSLLPLIQRHVQVATAPIVAVKTDAPVIPPQERKQQDEEALKRFRALGYLQ